MTEEEWLGCSLWEVRLDGLPNFTYRQFFHFLGAALPLLTNGEPCARCREKWAHSVQRADHLGAELLPPAGSLLHASRPRSSRGARTCQPHEMMHFAFLCEEGTLTIQECWNRILGEWAWRNNYVREKVPVAALAVLRDLVGNPFRPVVLGSPRRVPTVSALATAAYEERDLHNGALDPVRLAILADALEEAGCTDRAILDHLRAPGPHVRGCWAVDLLLAKE